MPSVSISASLLITVGAALVGAFGGQLLAHGLAGRRDRAVVRERRLEQDRVLYLDALDRLLDAMLVVARAITEVEANQSVRELHRTTPILVEAHIGASQAWTSYQARVRPIDVQAVEVEFSRAHKLAEKVVLAAQAIRAEPDRHEREELYGPIQGASEAYSDDLEAVIAGARAHSNSWLERTAA